MFANAPPGSIERLRAAEKTEPDVFASAPPPRSLERLPAVERVERAERVERVVPPQPVVAPRAGTVPISLPPASSPVSAFDYDSLQVMNILDISPTAARSRGSDAVRRIGAAYKEEVGFLDAGKPTPRLEQLIREGALTPNELDRLRRGAPLAMGGRTQEDLVLSSLRADLSRLSSDGKIDEMVDSLFAGRDTLKSDKSDKFKSLEAQVMGAVLGEPDAHHKALERIISREVSGFDNVPAVVRVQRGINDAEAMALHGKSPVLAEELGVRFDKVKNKYVGWGYDHAFAKHSGEFENSKNAFDFWINLAASRSGLVLPSGRKDFPNRMLYFIYDSDKSNLILLITDKERFWTMYHPKAGELLDNLENLVKAKKLDAFKESDDVRYIVKNLPDGKKHVVKISRKENRIIADTKIVESFDTSKMEKIGAGNLERFKTGRDREFGDISSLLISGCPP